MKEQQRLLRLLGGIIGLAWIPLFIYDWKLALLISLVLWSNNLLFYRFTEKGRQND